MPLLHGVTRSACAQMCYRLIILCVIFFYWIYSNTHCEGQDVWLYVQGLYSWNFFCSLTYVYDCCIHILNAADCGMHFEHNLRNGGQVMKYKQRLGHCKVIPVHCHSVFAQNLSSNAVYFNGHMLASWFWWEDAPFIPNGNEW